MKATAQLVLRSLGLSVFALAIAASGADAATRIDTESAPHPMPQIGRFHSDAVQHGGNAGALSKAVADSFNLYGGVKVDGTNDRRPEGQFETLIQFPDVQGWTGVDLTENPTFWHPSTFNASNINGTSGNRAMWSGVEAGTEGFLTAPGYGNNWNDVLEWRAQTNPTVNTNVRLTFDFNHDLEPGFDFFVVEFDSGGTWIPWYVTDGTNKDSLGVFLDPVTFDQTVTFTPLMYTGVPKADVRLRMRAVTDGAWSDEDGLFPSSGAVQVDDIRVFFNGALVTVNGDDGTASFEDLGGGVDDTEGWEPVSAAFAGDFAKIIPQLRDIDPCRTNLSPQLGFVDDGTPPSNSPVSTGGTTSLNWSYGVRNGWVVNYNGGISFGEVPLNNEWRSPVIAWDDTTTTEEDGLVGGAFMRFSVWQHLPLDNGMFWLWSVRSDDGSGFSPWQNRNFVYYGDGGGTYVNVQVDVTDLLPPGRTHVQASLGVVDLAGAFGFSGNDATPSPGFDNFSFWRYDVSGPAFATRNIDLFNDGFPNSGSLDTGNLADLSVRIDMARDISTGTANIPGDSIIVDVSPTVPGSTIPVAPVMKWTLDANPAFDAVRQIPAGAVNEGPGARGWTRWSGSAAGDSARTSTGAVVLDRWAFDAPNDGPAHASAPWQSNESAMFFPGDRLRYFIEASDDVGNVTTLPADTTGFASGAGYSRVFTVRALPSLVDPGTGIEQPEILVINDFGHRGGEGAWLSSFGQLGMVEDVDYDVYTVRGPSSLVSNGIGSAGSHGANGDQLGGYPVMLYLSGNLSDGLISDGTNLNGNDKGNDVETLNQWHALPGNRYMAYFGDDLYSFLNESGTAGQTYLTTIMGVQVADNDVRDELDGQAVSVVQATGAAGGLFVTEFVGFGGCLGVNRFDSISPLTPAVRTHVFLDNDNGQPFLPSASVWHGRTITIGVDDYERVDLSFPFDFGNIYSKLGTQNGGLSTRTLVLQEILQAFGQSSASGLPTAAGDAPGRLTVEGNVPNPFNPVTNIAFRTPARGPVSVKVYNLRGELVRTLLDETVDAGRHQATWNGTDAAGARVSSGVYLYEVVGFGARTTGKMALVK